MCDEVIDMGAESKGGAKSYNETNFNEGKTTCKTPIFFCFLVFLIINIALSIAVSISCYFIKYRTKQRHLLREVIF